jgi:large subunit ribosomal protein L6
MSRIGKKIIEIPSGVTVSVDSAAHTVTVQGKLGTLSEQYLPFITVLQEGTTLTVGIADTDDSHQAAMWGTTRALIANMIIGVSVGFTKELELSGVGFKMELAGSKLTLYIGFSHPVIVEIPAGITVQLNKNTLTGHSADKQLIGHFFTMIHNKKSADPYKHKGFKFPGRFYPKKVGKKLSK